MYARAEFTGVSSPYEAPAYPDLTLDTGAEPLEQSVDRLTRFVLGRLEGTAAG
jgi:adenylylsulfate kinase-like enzyme